MSISASIVASVTPDVTADLAARRYWPCAHRRALAHVHRTHAAYEQDWRRGEPARDEWQRLRIANARDAFCYRQVCRAMGW